MSRGYRSIIVAAFGWIVLCGAQPPAKQTESTSGSKQASEPDKPPFTAYSGYDPDRCYHAKDHDAADLCAQWRAAVAAEKAAHEARRATNWAIVATLLGALGTGFIVWTFAEQRTTSRRELRAYLSPERVGVFIERDARGRKQRTIGSNIEIKNTGETPAYDVRHWGEIVLAPFDQEGTLPLDTPRGGFANTVPRGGSIWKRRSTLRIGTDDYRNLKAGKLVVYVHGHIEYRDTFGKPRYTNYKLAWTGWPIPTDVMMNFAQSGNDAN